MELIKRHEVETCGCGVYVFTIPVSRSTTSPDIVIRYRHGVPEDCPYDHALGAKIVKGGRKQRRRQ